MGRLDNRIVVVTGGAKGLGRAAALRLAEDGAQVGILDLADAAPVCQEVRSKGGVAESWPCDVSDEEQVAQTFQRIGARFGRIDVLVNNAGILSPRKKWNEWTRAEIQRYLDINFMGYFLTTREAYSWLKLAEKPRVVNVASRTFFMGNPGQLPYVASKGAVQGLTWCLARELGEEGITVNAVMPGMVATDGTMAYNQDDAFNRVMQNQAIKERVTPEHLAAVIAFVASDDAALITGQTIICDGGGYLH